MMRTKMTVFFLACVIFFGAYYFSAPNNTMFAMDTVITIDIYDKNPLATKKLLKQSFALCKLYENRYSKTVTTSEVYRLNQGETVAVSDETLALLATAKKYTILSNGAFDITVKPLVDLWDVRIDQTNVPTATAIAQAKTTVNFENIQVVGNSVTLLHGTQIDLGGIAKGMIGDKIKAFLIANGCESAIVNLGGNVVTIGAKADGTPWNVGIRKPFSQDTLGVVEVSNQSVVTSGRYQRYFLADSVLYHHIIDPHTGAPANNELDAVTVICNESVDADALTTVCFVLGTTKGLALLESLSGFEGVFVEKDGTIYETSGLQNKFFKL